MSRPKKDATATAEPKVKRTAAEILADGEKLQAYRKEKLNADNILKAAKAVYDEAVKVHTKALEDADKRRKGLPVEEPASTQTPAGGQHLSAALEQPEGGA